MIRLIGHGQVGVRPILLNPHIEVVGGAHSFIRLPQPSLLPRRTLDVSWRGQVRTITSDYAPAPGHLYALWASCYFGQGDGAAASDARRERTGRPFA